MKLTFRRLENDMKVAKGQRIKISPVDDYIGKGCFLFSICNCKTAMCRVVLPDDSCYWYRYFKEIIKNNEK